VVGRHGRAVQVDPMKPKLKPPGAKRLKLKCDILLTTAPFKFNLRRYAVRIVYALGDDGRPILVRPCRLTLSSPC